MTTSGGNRARTDGGSTVRQSGIEVGKSYEADRFPVPAISLTIRSEREDPATVRLADRVSEDVSMDDVGFHPEYGSEFWSVDGHTLVFERELAPGEEIETVYGLRGPKADEPERFLGEPTMEVRAGDDSGSDGDGNGEVVEDDGGGGLLDDVNEPLVRNATFGDDSDEDATAEEELTADDPEAKGAGDVHAGDDSDGEAGSEATGESSEERSGDAEDHREPETGNAGEAGGPEATAAGATAPTDGSNESETGGDRGTATEDGIMTEEGRPDIERIEAENTATNTEAGPVPDEEAPNPPAEPAGSASSDGDADGGGVGGSDGGDVDAGEGFAAALARELRAGRIDSEDRETLREMLGPRDSVTVRLDRLGSRVEELAAYADALESFIDENGSARKLVRRQSERIDVLDEDMDGLTEEAATNRTDIETVATDIEAIDENVETIEGDIGAFRDAIADLDEDVERIDGQFESVEGNFEKVEERFERVESRLDSIDGRTDAAEDSIETVDDRLDSIDDRLDAIEATHESDMEGLREDLESQVDERVADTEESIESVAANVEALESWRAQLSAVVGGTTETGETGEASRASNAERRTETETDEEAGTGAETDSS
jgi:predicted  nucleic acid-binding Zn-ribbon protein